MSNGNEITPEAKRVFDRLVKAGWLEQLTDRPHNPNKGLHWIDDPDEPGKNGYAKLLAFNLLYSELIRFGPLTTDDLIMIEALGKTLRESNRDSN